MTAGGELKTTGKTTIQPGATQVQSSSFYFPPTVSSVFGPTTATIGIDHVIIRNPYGQLSTVDKPAFKVNLLQFSTSSGSCTTNGTGIAQWTAGPGETIDSNWTTPTVFKPVSAGTPYCIGFAVNGDPSEASGTYYLPAVSIHGSVLSGTYTGPGSSRSGSASAPRGDIRYTPGDRLPGWVVGGP